VAKARSPKAEVRSHAQIMLPNGETVLERIEQGGLLKIEHDIKPPPTH
jgi:hypothetical protein